MYRLVLIIITAGMLGLLAVPVSVAAERIVYLTFDDGPLPGTENVLHVLFDEDVPATMFMVGVHVETKEGGRAILSAARSLPDVMIGNHSYSHANNRYRDFYSDSAAVIADLERANGVLGLTMPTAARLPGRNVFRLNGIASEDLSLDIREWQREWIDFELVSEAGFHLYGWDHEWVHDKDGKPIQSVDTVVREIDALFAYNRLVRPGRLILLTHDVMFQDKFDGEEKLRSLIRKLKQRGYRFESLVHYQDGGVPD